jgi:uncharacterized protein (DUF1697 family)
MTRFVAFLRGINVGGHIVKKAQLQEAFAGLGFRDVRTYRVSGNIIFESDKTNIEEVKSNIEQKIGSSLGYEVAVFIRTVEQLKTIISFDFYEDCGREGASFLVTLLPTTLQTFPLQLPLTIPKSTAQVVAFRGSEVYSVTHGGGEGALPNPFVESTLKLKATTRNLNVIGEIVEKYGN